MFDVMSAFPSAMLDHATTLMAAEPGFEPSVATYAWAFGQGVLVDLTPCVYPLIPITVAVFGAQGVSKGRALFLASAYVLGMAVLYTSLALVAGVSGAQFGSWLANPFVVTPIAVLLLALAASMFGAYDLQLPPSLQTKLNSVGGAGPIGAFLMGLVSGLISAPCTGPVLLSLLTYVAKVSAEGGSLLYGASLMFTYSLGMGTLFFAVALGASLMAPGAWMENVKSVFGIALVIMVWWFLRPLFPEVGNIVLNPNFGLFIAILVIGIGVAIGAVHLSFKNSRQEALRKGAGVLVAVVGGFFFLNSLLYVELTADWKKVHTIEELQAAFVRADEADKPLLVDFGAEWCTPCKEMDAKVFSQPEVEQTLGRFELVKIDVTDPDDEQQAMQAALHGQTLPAVVVYGPDVPLTDYQTALEDGTPLPEPTVNFNQLLEPEEFLERLAPVL